MWCRLRFVKRDGTKECLTFDKITILVDNPITNSVGAWEPTVISGKDLWSDTAFVRAVWTGAMA
jgi:hypothetical protein